MLEFQKTDDLERMYIFLSRVPGGLQTMASRVSAHFRQEGKGKKLVNAITSGTISGVDSIEVFIYHIVSYPFNLIYFLFRACWILKIATTCF